MAEERLPPQNVEAEQSVLGSILIDRDAIVRVAGFLRAEDFYREAHRTIYQASLDLFERREPADFVLLCDELERRGRLEGVGGPAYLTSLINAVPTAVNVEFYGHVVERCAILRRLITAGGQIAGVAYDLQHDAELAVDKAEQILFGLTQRRRTQEFVPLAQVLESYFDQIDYIHQNRGKTFGVPTGFRELDELTGGLQRSDLIIVAARPGMGKCLTPWTLIDDPATGERVSLETYVQQRRRTVFGVSETGWVRAADVSAWVDSGMQPCYRVTTRTGRLVEVTGHHPFLTVDGWVPLNELGVGARIAVPRGVPAFGTDEAWPEALVRLLAYYIAEGGLTGTSPSFTNTDPVIVEDFRRIIAEHFSECRIRQERITYVVARQKVRAVMPPNPVTVWLQELGVWGKRSSAKAFPACVWRWTRRYLAAFLRTLFSCDATIYGMGGYPRVELTVASEQLARDAHHALVRFGIIAKLYRTKYGAWRVEITEPESVRTYQLEIGWLGEKAARFPEPADHVRRSIVGHPPPETWALVRCAARERGLALMAVARQSGETVHYGGRGFNLHTRRSIPSRRLARYAEVLASERLRLIASPDLFWDRIEAVEYIGEHQVYDLSVVDGANFIAQDVCVHNTSFALNIAAHAALKNHVTCGIFSLEMSRDQLVQRLICSEAGIDSHRLRTGYIEEGEWAKIAEAIGLLSEAPVYIDDTPGISIMELRTKARRLQAENDLGFIVVDYLQLMQGNRTDNRVQEVSDISRGLKALARELNAPVMALSQLSRAVEQRPGNRPQLSDLRESGCLAGETEVFLPDEGAYRRIDELVGKCGFNVLALNTDTWKLEPRPVLRAFATGHKPVFALKTRLGRTIRATANHKFLTIGGWRRLDELAPGARVALPRRLPSPPAPTMTHPELALLGHLIGDGCTLPRQPVHYTTNDLELATVVAGFAVQVFGEAVAPRITRERDWYQVYLASARRLTHGVRNPVAAWLDELGVFGLRSHQKYVPARVFAQPEGGIARFLAHLWSTDGTIWMPTKPDARASAVYYASCSERLARGVQALLLRLEISATLIKSPQPGKGRDQYHVVVSGKPDLERFVAKVGAVGSVRQRRLDRLQASLAVRKANTNRDVVPSQVWRQYAVPAIEAAGITCRSMQAALGNAYCGTSLYRQNLSRERAGRLARVVGSAELAQLAQSDVYWDEVTQIEPAGEADVYDLTVQEDHNFVANDILVHNSIEQDADIVMFIYREEQYDRETQRKNIADIIVAKHRNGPLKDIELRFTGQQTKFTSLEQRYSSPR
jgi:replicative DNA helicase